MLKDMANEFIKLRGDNNLYLITKHEDRDHVHLHVAISSAQLNGMSSRVTKEKYAEIKKSLDSIQRLRYPQLTNSLPEHGKSKQSRSHESKLEKIKFAERNEKATLLKLLETTYEKSTSTEHFLSQIAVHGFQPYYRAGRFQGIKGVHKFRLTTLNFKEKLQALDARQAKQEKSLAQLKELRTNRSREPIRSINETAVVKETKNVVANKEQSALEELATIRIKNERERDRAEDMGRDISDNENSGNADDKDDAHNFQHRVISEDRVQEDTNHEDNDTTNENEK
jgi:hypothetical protein